MATAESAVKILCTGTCQTENTSECRTVPDDADDTCHETAVMPDSQFHSSKSIFIRANQMVRREEGYLASQHQVDVSSQRKKERFFRMPV